MEDLEKSGRTSERKRLDLSFTQVAASALAAVVGALLASQLGVYGTILGAAVVSAGATVGSALFQHVFRRTGEQLRELSGGGVPMEQSHRVETSAERDTVPDSGTKTQVFDPFDRGGEHTRMMAHINPPDPAEAVAVYRGRTTWRPKSRRVYAVTATLVFVIALATVSVMELAVGRPADQFFFGGGGGGQKPDSGTSAPVDPSGSPSPSTAGTGADGHGQSDGAGNGGKASPGASTTPSPDPSSGSGTGSGTGGTSPSPDPSSSTGSRAGGGSGTGAGAGQGAGISGTGGSAGSGDALVPKASPSP